MAENMNNNHLIVITERPDWVSFDDIHQLLYAAHVSTREKGIMINTATMDAKALQEHIGESGQCFVALDGDRLVGTISVRIIERNTHYMHGKVTDPVLLGILPDYRGKHISTMLFERVIRFAEEHTGVIEGRVAEENLHMQEILLKWGYQYVDFHSFKNVDHYTVALYKWFPNCPYSKLWLKLRFQLKKAYVKLRFKPGKIKRFGI